MLKKGLIAGFVNLILGLIINWIITAGFPQVAKEYQNTEIFRSFSDPLMMIFFAYPFILGIVAAYFWNLIKEKLPKDQNAKVFAFAKIYFIIATIPGMFISYTSFQLSLTMILVWTITGYLEALAAGWIFARIK